MQCCLVINPVRVHGTLREYQAESIPGFSRLIDRKTDQHRSDDRALILQPLPIVCAKRSGLDLLQNADIWDTTVPRGSRIQCLHTTGDVDPMLRAFLNSFGAPRHIVSADACLEAVAQQPALLDWLMDGAKDSASPAAVVANLLYASANREQSYKAADRVRRRLGRYDLVIPGRCQGRRAWNQYARERDLPTAHELVRLTSRAARSQGKDLHKWLERLALRLKGGEHAELSKGIPTLRLQAGDTV